MTCVRLWEGQEKAFEVLWGIPALLSLIVSNVSPFSSLSLSFAICTVG